MKDWSECPTCHGKGYTTDARGRPLVCQRSTQIFSKPAKCIRCGGTTWRRLSRSEGICRGCEIESVAL
jgi:primosomal protein N'